MTQPSVTTFAPAKLNLYLHVLGCRDDGYHILDSLVVFANIGDKIDVTPADRPSLEIRGPFAGPMSQSCSLDDNLAFKAMTLLANKIGRPPEAHITLTKNLPIASGIGGGSSDAAATLRALSVLWNIDDHEMLIDLAGRLGADVPVCLYPRTSYFGGIGDELTQLDDFPEFPIVLANPGDSVPTPKVFARFNGPYSRPARLTPCPQATTDLASLLATRHNDLTRPAHQILPDIRDILGLMTMQKGCLLSRMSGSGATCFGIFDTEQHADRAVMEMREIRPDWWIAHGLAGGFYPTPPQNETVTK